MLRKNRTKRARRAAGRFAIVASKYNAVFVNSMVKAAVGVLRSAGVRDIQMVRVPGAYEIPVVAARLARVATPPLSGVICLGVILRGETAHAQLIGEAVTRALMEAQVQAEVPMIHEVLLLENREQARVRCLSPEHNRGAEAAQTALEMARIMESLQRPCRK
jgi:6,7-dimethyl-8-ribityllumazine synthase